LIGERDALDEICLAYLSAGLKLCCCQGEGKWALPLLTIGDTYEIA